MEKNTSYRFIKTLAACLLITVILLLYGQSVQAMTVNAKLISQTKIRLTWRGVKKATAYKIQKVLEKNGNVTYKTIKVLGKGSRSYTVSKLKKNRSYQFCVVACEKKKGKLKDLNYGYQNVFTGVASPSWDEYAWEDAPCSPTKIVLWLNCGSASYGLKPSGFQIYRKEVGTSRYKKIATVGAKISKYTDKKVTAGKSYQYKYRAYTKYKGKKKYSAWSEILQRRAVNREGSFSCSQISRTATELVLKISNSANNGLLEFRSGEEYFLGNTSGPYWDDEDDDVISVKPAQWSVDNSSWNTIPENSPATVDGGKSIYIRFICDEGKDLTTVGNILSSEIVTYNRTPCTFVLSINGSGSVHLNEEYIH